MKKRFTEEQIIGFLREADAGLAIEVLHIEVDTSITSTRLVRIFEQLRRVHGCLPQVLGTDNGPELLGEVFVRWAKAHGMAIRYVQPGKPNQNVYIERFNRAFFEEALDQHLLLRVIPPQVS